MKSDTAETQSSTARATDSPERYGIVLAAARRDALDADADPSALLATLDRERRLLIDATMARDGYTERDIIPFHRWEQDYACDHEWHVVNVHGAHEAVECGRPNCYATDRFLDAPIAGRDY